MVVLLCPCCGGRNRAFKKLAPGRYRCAGCGESVEFSQFRVLKQRRGKKPR